MLGGGDQRRVYTLRKHSTSLVEHDPSILGHSVENSTLPREETRSESQKAAYIIKHSEKLEGELKEHGQKVKYHEDNLRYLLNQKTKLESSIRKMQVDVGKHFAESENNDSNSEEETLQQIRSYEETIDQILKYKNSAAAILCKQKRKFDNKDSDHPFTKDVIGIVATLGRVNDDYLSRLLSGYLGLDTMLTVVCKTYEGVKALEAYNSDGSIDKKVGLHAIEAPDCHFQVICIENLRPYEGEVQDGDPQRKLNLLEPRLLSGEIPPGFLGFAVNLINFDYTSSHCMSKTGYSLRETLFYHLFDTTQIYRTRQNMLDARACITSGAISLDGGFIRSPGIFSLGLQRGDIDVRFPIGSERYILPDKCIKIKEKMKDAKLKKEHIRRDIEREQVLLNLANLNCEKKKLELTQFMNDSLAYTTTKMGRVSTSR